MDTGYIDSRLHKEILAIKQAELDRANNIIASLVSEIKILESVSNSLHHKIEELEARVTNK